MILRYDLWKMLTLKISLFFRGLDINQWCSEKALKKIKILDHAWWLGKNRVSRQMHFYLKRWFYLHLFLPAGWTWFQWWFSGATFLIKCEVGQVHLLWSPLFFLIYFMALDSTLFKYLDPSWFILFLIGKQTSRLITGEPGVLESRLVWKPLNWLWSQFFH